MTISLRSAAPSTVKPAPRRVSKEKDSSSNRNYIGLFRLKSAADERAAATRAPLVRMPG
jgi:hypothetical protein